MVLPNPLRRAKKTTDKKKPKKKLAGKELPPDYLKPDKAGNAFANRVSRRRRRDVVSKESRRVNFRRARGTKWRGR
jgi:hypothetical protein